MVGRFVEQQNVGRRRKRTRDRRPARLTAGKPRHILVAAKAELLQQIPRLVRVVARREPGLHISQCGGRIGEVRLLRQIADGDARLQETRAAIRLDQSGCDAQQRRFARSVAADQAQPLARPRS